MKPTSAPPPRARAAWRASAVLALVAAAACTNDPAEITGLRVTVQWTDLQIDGLEFRLTTEAGQSLADPLLRQGRAVVSGADLVVNLPDRLAGTRVRIAVDGLQEGRLVRTSNAVVTAVRNRLVDVLIDLNGTVGGDRGGDAGPPDLPSERGLRNLGEPCEQPSDCLMGMCADGVCCDSACEGTCRGCAVAGKVGICSELPLGTPDMSCPKVPESQCGYDGTCNGKGQCSKWAAGTTCRAGTCAGSSITGGAACDGVGNCVDGPTQTCSPFLCNTSGAAPRCHGTCTSDAQCIPGRSCDNNSCGKKLDGAVCAVGTECASGNCVGGICCNAPCTGACVTCSLPDALGQCRPVPEGAADPRNVCQDTGVASCGTNGKCDGRGACMKYPSGAICEVARCASETTQMAARRCDGLGACAPATGVACSPFLCKNNVCGTKCESNADCAPGRVCDVASGSCGLRGLGQACTAGTQCLSGFCATEGVCCNEACAGPCRSCTAGRTPGVCTLTANGGTDPRRVCVDQGTASCGTDGFCNGTGGCRRYAPGTVCGGGSCSTTTNIRTLGRVCSTSGTCVAGTTRSCAPYRCNGAVCFTACSTNAECASPNVCIGGSCVLKPTGTSCSSASECATGNCLDGVCCQAMTCTACTACNVTGSRGTCAPVAAGTRDPRNSCTAASQTSCGNDGTCDGAGACRKYVAGTSCGSAVCPAGTSVLTRAPACNGSGMCSAGNMQSCTPYLCDGASACKTSCASDADCDPPYQCNAQKQCGTLKALGASCSSADECTSRFCVDGVCCATGSCASCTACNVAGKAGSCAPVPEGTMDPRNMCAPDPVLSCDKDGRCDGSGGCRSYPAGTMCVGATCMGNSAVPARTCNGTGICQSAGSAIDCTPYGCSNGACPTTCSSDAACASGYYCIGTSCQKKPLGATCSADTECASTHCTDGVCCDSSACGKCKACNVSGFLGSCQDLPDGTTEPNGLCAPDDPSTCKQDGKCNGAGSCRNWPAGTVCAASSCNGGVNLSKARTCDGTGTCRDNGSTNCAPFKCDGAAMPAACFASCTDDSQCSGGSSCSGGSCQ